MMTPGGSADFADRRRAPRYRIALPVELEQGSGITRDISTSGVFFETNRLFSPGAPISFSVLFEYLDPEGERRLRCQGHVVRVEPRQQGAGVAVALSSYSF